MRLAMMTRLAVLGPLIVLGVVACRSDRSAGDPVCHCTPGNASRARQADGTAMDGLALVGKLRQHRQLVAEHRNPRDVKVFDDELRLAIIGYCQPCGDWVQDRLTIDDMFPLVRLDDAASAVCMGLVLHDGTTAYGSARPAACR